MCWIQIPDKAVRDEVLARIESDAAAIHVHRCRCQANGWWLAALAAAFIAGVLVGRFWMNQDAETRADLTVHPKSLWEASPDADRSSR